MSPMTALRVAFGARWAEIVCGGTETNESLVAWEAATRPRPVSPHINQS